MRCKCFIPIRQFQLYPVSKAQDSDTSFTATYCAAAPVPRKDDVQFAVPAVNNRFCVVVFRSLKKEVFSVMSRQVRPGAVFFPLKT